MKLRAFDIVFTLIAISFIVCGYLHGGDFSTCWYPKTP